MSAPHGGNRRAAATRWGIPEADWLDLSTGIAPWAWPVPAVPEAVWARLPEPDDGLIAAAADYYEVPAECLLAVPGSQFAIREWPRHIPPGTVAVPATGYTEHAAAWAAAGHRLVRYADLDALTARIDELDHAVVLAPNNPTGEMPDAARLAVIAARLGPGRLVIDAAFADCRPEPIEWPAGAIVLRSVGKFFGLAGMRLGFVIADPDHLAPLAATLGPWGVAHPARWIGAQALADTAWQAAQRRRIDAAADWLSRTLAGVLHDATTLTSGGLFLTARFASPGPAGRWHAGLAAQGVLTRLGDDDHWLRFGLPAREARPRLAAALHRVGGGDGPGEVVDD